MTRLHSAAKVRCFCQTGLTLGSMLSLLVMMLGEIPVISRGDQAKTSPNSHRSWIICFLRYGTSMKPTLTTLSGRPCIAWLLPPNRQEQFASSLTPTSRGSVVAMLGESWVDSPTPLSAICRHFLAIFWSPRTTTIPLLVGIFKVRW